MLPASTSRSRPTVSVLVITYNHERQIEQAVRSILMQQTAFPVEVVIGEDCSTDRTREIVAQLREEFPDRITLILHPRNLGMAANFVATYRACRGKYIALLEGDDCWTHPLKLQRQVEHLEAHRACRISAHAAQVVDDGGHVVALRDFENAASVEEYFSIPKHLVTSSMLFRVPDAPLPDWFARLQASCDWPLHVWLLTQGGGICYLEGEPMSCWRVHSGGSASFMKYAVESLSEEEKYRRSVDRIQRVIGDYELVQRELQPALQPSLRPFLVLWQERLAHLAYGRDPALFQHAYAELCRLSPTGRYLPASPPLLATASRLLGYPRAEWLGRLYRGIIPPAWRRRVFETLFHRKG